MSLELDQNKKVLPRIITVDDDPRILMMMKAQLVSFFQDVVMFENPLDVLNYLHSNDRDVLITDGMMPQMRGEVLANEVRRLYPAVGRVLVSGTLKEHVSDADPNLFDSTLAKPYTRQPLLDAINIAYTRGLARR